MATRALQGRTLQPPPWEPAIATAAEIRAIKAIAAGEATKDEQLTLLAWMRKATAVSELEFRADSERASSFAAGKRFVGLQFFGLIKAAMPQE